MRGRGSRRCPGGRWQSVADIIISCSEPYGDSADDIVKRMQDVRRDVGDDVQGIRRFGEDAVGLAVLRQEPSLAVRGRRGGARVPARPRKAQGGSAGGREGTDRAAQEAQSERRHRRRPPSKGLAATVIGMAAPFVMRAAMQAAQQYFKDGRRPIGVALRRFRRRRQRRRRRRADRRRRGVPGLQYPAVEATDASHDQSTPQRVLGRTD